MLSDLNSVIIEGVITKTWPMTNPTENPNKLEICSTRMHKKNETAVQEKSCYIIDVSHLQTNIRNDLGMGKKIRVVGRLCLATKKIVNIHAEHLEIKHDSQATTNLI